MLTDFMHGTIHNRWPEHGYLHVSGDTTQWIDGNETVDANHIYVACMQMLTLNKVE